MERNNRKREGRAEKQREVERILETKEDRKRRKKIRRNNLKKRKKDITRIKQTTEIKKDQWRWNKIEKMRREYKKDEERPKHMKKDQQMMEKKIERSRGR